MTTMNLSTIIYLVSSSYLCFCIIRLKPLDLFITLISHYFFILPAKQKNTIMTIFPVTGLQQPVLMLIYSQIYIWTSGLVIFKVKF